ncbi:hypothetical protein D3Z58_04330 [Clostridiaceae bacterium]|nr:hypothetical protein [Clostridiaceae bacterium]
MYLIDRNRILRAMEREDNELLKAMINNPEMERNMVGWLVPSSNEKQMIWYENTMSSDTDFKDMRDTDCSLFVPVLVPNGKRDRLRRYLIENEIYCLVHWMISEYHRLKQ